LPIAVISGHYLQTSGIIYFIGELEERLCSFMGRLDGCIIRICNKINDAKIILKKRITHALKVLLFLTKNLGQFIF
jgi:hypothetical protein